MTNTRLRRQRAPTDAEQAAGAEVVFERTDGQGRRYTIFACTCYESWQQWGEPREVLGDNVEDVERWRRALPETDDDEEDE